MRRRCILLIVGAFILVQGLYLTFSAMIRAFAMVKEVMIISVIMNAMNIVGNAILINGWFGMPQLGAVGAAISTDISKLVGLALMIGMFFKSRRVKMGMSYLRPFPVQILKNLCLLAIPTGVESFSYNLSQMIILGIVNSFGTLVTVTKGYCTIFANIDYVYAMAIATATQIVLGYLIGARRLNDADVRDIVRSHRVKGDLQLLHIAAAVVRGQDTVCHGAAPARRLHVVKVECTVPDGDGRTVNGNHPQPSPKCILNILYANKLNLKSANSRVQPARLPWGFHPHPPARNPIAANASAFA